MTVLLRRHKFTVTDYMRMGECGILGPDERTELIEGEIIDSSPIGNRHAPGEMVAPLAFPDEPFAVSEFLGLDLGQ